MNKWVKRKWVKALRSGEYKQAQGTLFLDERGEVTNYCCLAVVIAEMFPGAFDGREDTYYGTSVNVGAAQEDGRVADDLAILWGLDQDSQDILADMNDDGASFPAIADWIDENL